MPLVRPVAAIDCGTNSTRLLVADGDGQALDRQMRITRLGEGVDANGELTLEAITRTVAVLRDYRLTMDRLAVDKGRLVATSAVRDAANGSDFMEAAAEATGLVPELLTGVEEGRLSLSGAVTELDPKEGPFLVVDIGGGSTELVVGESADDPLLVAVSIQMGCVRVTERFLHSDPPAPAELEAAEGAVAAELDSAIAAAPRLTRAHCPIGLAGTVSTLAALRLGLREYDRSRIHHSVLTARDVADWYRTLASEVAVARLDRAGMEAGREDIIVGGAMILYAVMQRFGFTECLVSESDILDGMVGGLLSG
ncbi:MAG: Ppx/GppA family phosphatase [Acidimicrobiales bacterium]|nr:Ppx/GppA family phosphatase [Acidimicrobiales bacterium]